MTATRFFCGGASSISRTVQSQERCSIFGKLPRTGSIPRRILDQHPENLRCRMHTGADGKYEMRVIRPSAYTVPYDGPVGDLLRAGGRHAWRPAHFHFIVGAPGFHSVVTELFNAEDTYIDEDAAFGVRDSILVKFERDDSPEEAAALRLNSPFYVVDFDFRLRPDL